MRSRANRYQTAAEVEADLRGFLRKYLPTYSRSNLGRYVRKMFAQEIERELRMLEEYVLADDVSDDLGVNLIASGDDFQAAEVPFQPKPTSTHIAIGPDAFGDASQIAQQPAPPRALGNPEIHDANTMILDTRAPARRSAPAMSPTAAAPRPAAAMPYAPPIYPAPYTPAAHDEPTAAGPIVGASGGFLAPEPAKPRPAASQPWGNPAKALTETPPIELVDSDLLEDGAELEDDLHNAPTQIIDLERLRRRG